MVNVVEKKQSISYRPYLYMGSGVHIFTGVVGISRKSRDQPMGLRRNADQRQVDTVRGAL